MFLTRISSTVSGRSTKGARRSYAPDGKLIAELFLACGNGSVKYPTMYVKVCVWEALAEKALAVIDRKGLNIGASGFLQVKQYEGKYGKSVLIELMDVRELKMFDRDGELVQVLNGNKAE
jgi:single-stranded DNA-binding protein